METSSGHFLVKEMLSNPESIEDLKPPGDDDDDDFDADEEIEQLNPLSIPLLVDRVFQNLSFKFLKECRLVCKNWNNVALVSFHTPQLFNEKRRNIFDQNDTLFINDTEALNVDNICQIFGNTSEEAATEPIQFTREFFSHRITIISSSYQARFRDLNQVYEEFLRFFSATDETFKKYGKFIKITIQIGRPLNFYYAILSLIKISLTDLRVYFPFRRTAIDFDLEMVENVQFLRLRHLEVESRRSDLVTRTFLSQIVKNAPNLQSLVLKMSISNNTSSTIANLDVISQNIAQKNLQQLEKLQMEKVDSTIMVKLVELLNSGFKLKSFIVRELSLTDNWMILNTFFDKCRGSLELFRIKDKGGVARVNIEEVKQTIMVQMDNLRTLDFTINPRYTFLSPPELKTFSSKFPQLVKLTVFINVQDSSDFGQVRHDPWFEFFASLGDLQNDEDFQPLPSLTKLTLNIPDVFNEKCLTNMEKLFPNLDQLLLVAKQNHEESVIEIHKSINHLLTLWRNSMRRLKVNVQLDINYLEKMLSNLYQSDDNQLTLYENLLDMEEFEIGFESPSPYAVLPIFVEIRISGCIKLLKISSRVENGQQFIIEELKGELEYKNILIIKYPEFFPDQTPEKIVIPAPIADDASENSSIYRFLTNT